MAYVPKPAARREVPPDFQEFAPAHGLHEIRIFYRCGTGTVQRWCTETGVNYRRRTIKASHKEDDVEPHDCRAAIETCLHCQEPVCSGDCHHVKDARADDYAKYSRSKNGSSRYTQDHRHYVMHLFRIGYGKRQISRFTGVNYHTIANWLEGVRQCQKPSKLPSLESKRQEWEAIQQSRNGVVCER